MLPRAAVLLLAALALAGAWQAWARRAVHPPPGLLVPELPLQSELEPEDPPRWEQDGVLLLPQARYDIRGRLLARDEFHLGREARLAPIDFGLGWGPMSDSAVLDRLRLSQRQRFLFVSWKEPPLPPEVLLDHAANTHLIPASKTVRRQLDRVRPGQRVRLMGYLVNARAADGWTWNSSMRRDDRGVGACELMWVDSVFVEP